MNFTSHAKLAAGILIAAAGGLIEWGGHPASSTIIPEQNSSAVEEPFQADGPVRIIAAPEILSEPSLQPAAPDNYQQVTAWYKNKHWWKKNAPIIGGAGGGALVGGLLGGGKGVLIGGAVGGGGGYLYKRSKRHHENYHHHQ